MINNDTKMTISIPPNIYEAMLEEVHKNKIENMRKHLKGKDKKPDSLTELVRIALEKVYVKK